MAAGDDARQYVGRLQPLSATVGPRPWSPVTTLNSMVNIRGGYNTRGEPARSIEYTVGHTSHTFVALDKNATWFLKGVAGPAVRKGDLKAVQVMQVIREKLNQKLGLDDDNTAVADTARAEPRAVEVDPMDAMDERFPDTPVKTTVPKTLKKRSRVT